ncbi:hypothetical protein NDR87_13705 [Nocardia sp. CDC159]|uniref:Uncharacterized protein n=1 Tax=Nocardia pulmonis TaxID=2951408 RepID=A0A9X2E570_9NOCA|nr:MULTISPECIES: hypothetical protein [Nocardia]MCM6774522.1 hypothetical protein [Nocardia pulmonis]MCM6787412.1 hypothetical protein [Nocardia sp. CDC159]
MTDSRAFLDAIADLDITFAYDRRAARDRFTAALELATPADHEFLDDMIESFVCYPFPTALRRLEAKWAGDETQRERMLRLLPDTDPHLYVRDRADRLAVIERRARRNKTSVEDEYFAEHTGLAVAEMPRQSIRFWRNAPGRLFLAPSRATATSSVEQVRKRILARGKRRPATVEPADVTAYVGEQLYIDTAARELAKLRAKEDRLRTRGLLPDPEPAEWTPLYPGHTPPADADYLRERWDYELVHYVAEQRMRAVALAGKRPISEENALVQAGRRTRLRGDMREEIPSGGNGLDYDHEAMNPIVGWRCVSCFIERALADQRALHVHNGHRRSDDGLCDFCRDDRPGLPELPAGFTGRDLARAYCRFLTTRDPAELHPDAAHAVLAETRRRAPRWLRPVIDETLVTTRPVTEESSVPAESSERARPTARTARRGPVLPLGQRQARCDGCTRIRGIYDDGYCTECRVWLGLPIPSARQRAA